MSYFKLLTIALLLAFGTAAQAEWVAGTDVRLNNVITDASDLVVVADGKDRDLLLEGTASLGYAFKNGVQPYVALTHLEVPGVDDGSGYNATAVGVKYEHRFK